MNITTAVICAAGEGSRLDQKHTIKPLVLIGNKPLILWNVLQLQEAGVDHIVVVVGYRGDEIRRFLIGHKEVTARIEFVENSDYSDGGLNASFPVLSRTVRGPSFMIMADLVIHDNPYKLFDRDDRLLSLVDVRPDAVSLSGAQSQVMMDHERITNIGRGLVASDGVEVGVYVIPSGGYDRFCEVAQLDEVDSFNDSLSYLACRGELFPVFMQKGEWFDVNTPATKIRAEIYYREKRFARHDETAMGDLKEYEVDFVFDRDRDMESTISVKRGLLDTLSSHVVVPPAHADSLHILLTDDMVDSHYGDRVLSLFKQAGYHVKKIVVPHGEASKSLEWYGRLSDEILSAGIDKRSYIISLGGGVINNIAGFLSSTLYRGIGLVHIPTSMMAQVDAAIDFKQAINSDKGKNLLGSYYPADQVLIDPDVLQTLEERHVRNGIAESIKHALCQDEDLFDYLMDHAENVYDPEYLEEVVRRTIVAKLPLLNGDVEDDYHEMLPQYGHSVGHAVEHLSAYDMLHGEAIAVGMCVSAEIARLLGMCGDDVVEKHYEICDRYKMPGVLPESMAIKDVISTIRFDKHYVTGNPQMALPVAIGKMHNEDGVYGIPVDYELLERALERNIARRGGVNGEKLFTENMKEKQKETTL